MTCHLKYRRDYYDLIFLFVNLISCVIRMFNTLYKEMILYFTFTVFDLLILNSFDVSILNSNILYNSNTILNSIKTFVGWHVFLSIKLQYDKLRVSQYVSCKLLAS